jgi:hypothetical protein
MAQFKTESNIFTNEYDESVQRTLIAFLIADHDTFKACRHVVRPEYFDDHLRRAIRFILKHEAETKTLPSAPFITAMTGNTSPPLSVPPLFRYRLR